MGMGRIPDWTPVYYTPEQVKVGFIYTADFIDLCVQTVQRNKNVIKTKTRKMSM